MRGRHTQRERDRVRGGGSTEREREKERDRQSLDYLTEQSGLPPQRRFTGTVRQAGRARE